MNPRFTLCVNQEKFNKEPLPFDQIPLENANEASCYKKVKSLEALTNNFTIASKPAAKDKIKRQRTVQDVTP